MKTKNIYLVIVIFLLQSNSFAQFTATPREIFLCNLKINQLLPTDYAYISSNFTSTIKWYEYYGSMMNNSKYLSSINDEFRSEEYKKGLIDEILIGWNNQDLNKKFFVTYNLKFGTYNSDCQCFPFENENRILPSYTLLAVKDFANWRRPLMGSYFEINLTNFFNFTDIDFSLRLKPSEAERLIAARKDGYGNVNRTIQAKVIFNFVNKPIESRKNEYNLGCYIHKIEFYDNGRLISTLTPKTDYSDKVNLIIRNNGTDTIYLDTFGNEVPSADANTKARYSQTRTYQNGKMTGPVLRYYFPENTLSAKGTLENGIYEGEYTEYFDGITVRSQGTYKNGKANGVFVSWYSNGKKASEFNYSEGKKNGLCTEWHYNGKKASEVSYVNDLKNGCDYNWEESGKCKRGAWAAWGGYVDYYENGTTKIGSSKCPCNDQTNQTTPIQTNPTNNNQTNPTNNNQTNYKSYYNSRFSDGEYKFVNGGIFYKSNTAEIKRAFISGGTRISKDADLTIQGGLTLSTHIFIDGFKQVGDKYNFTYSLCTTFENGEVFEKRENVEDYSYVHPQCDFGFDYNTPSIKGNSSSKTLYINFLIKDKNSEALIQGFYKFILTR